MPGLSLETRVSLCRELERRALSRQRVGDGTRRLAVMPTDAAVFAALALDFHNGQTGQTCPGFRALAAKARVSRGTVANATRRLKAAGWIGWRLGLRVVHGALRFVRNYVLHPTPPAECPNIAPKPSKNQKGAVERMPKPQPPARSAATQRRIAEEWAQSSGADPAALVQGGAHYFPTPEWVRRAREEIRRLKSAGGLP